MLLLSSSVPSRAAAGDKVKEHPVPAPSFFPSCTRTGGAGGEGSRHGQRRCCIGTSASRDQIWCGRCGIMHRRVISANQLVQENVDVKAFGSDGSYYWFSVQLKMALD